jgi:ABC-type transport system involved in multi-copper enzyme maturation permease subunit
MTGTLTKRLRVFWANPVVTRDLRVRMRGSKSYWHQGFYLLLLGLLALLGYGTAVGWSAGGNPDGMSAVEVQQQLQGFYYFIFITLAALITLIAPALTAVSITTERQRLSLDLLVTTPLSASELLVGKMISSVAFLALLLALSLPASALCVILGGATFGDVVRIYLLLAIDGLLMATIGLAVSCTVRASLPALVWSYLMVALFLILTGIVYGTLGVYGRMGMGVAGGVAPINAIAVLDPFVAVIVGSQSFQLFSLHVPLWVGAAAVAFLLIRLLVTTATYRLGRYGGNPIGSLRRQLLFITGLAVFGLAYSIFKTMASFPGASAFSVGPELASFFEIGLIVIFIMAALLLPSLFTPAVPNEDDPPGIPVVGWYSPRRTFRPEHAGALPFFHLWLLTVAVTAVLGMSFGGGSMGTVWKPLLLTLFYLSGLGFLFWSLARRSAALVNGVTVLAWLPIATLGILYANIGEGSMNDSPLAWAWIFYPLMKFDPTAWRTGQAVPALLWSGAFCYGLGALIYPFWQNVTPGGRRKKEAAHVASV